MMKYVAGQRASDAGEAACVSVPVWVVCACPCIQQFYHSLCSCLCQTPEENAVVFYSGHSAQKQNGPIERERRRESTQTHL